MYVFVRKNKENYLQIICVTTFYLELCQQGSDLFFSATITLGDSCKDAQHGTKGKEGKVFCKATAGGVNLYTYWERDGKVLDPDSGRKLCF